MAKKSLKNQPKQAITTNLTANTVPSARNISTPAVTITSQPASIVQTDTLASPATRVAFREFIELADLNSIKVFITAASSSSEGENLKLLWGRAFKEGLVAGHKLYGKTEERLKVVQAEAYEEGFQEGQRNAHEDWALDGHGLHCGYNSTVPYDDYGTLPDSIQVATVTSPIITASVSTQIDPPLSITTSAFTQTDLPDVSNASNHTQTSSPTTISSTTTNNVTQTDPIRPPDSPKATTTSVSMQTEPQMTSTASPSSPSSTTSRPTLAAQPPSMMTTSLTAVTTTASSQFPTPRKRRHSLPNHSRSSHLSSQAPNMSSTRRHSIATSSTPTATPVSKNTPKTSNQAMFSYQKVIVSSETTYTMSNEVQGCPKTQETEPVEPRNDKRSGMSKHAVSSSEHAGSLRNAVRRSRRHTIPTGEHQLDSTFKKPVATSTTSPISGNSSISSSTTRSSLSAPFVATTGLKTPPTTTCNAQNYPESPKSPISKCFNWADDISAFPTIPMFPQHPPRNLSCLRSPSAHPFSSLRRRSGRSKNQWNPRRHRNHLHFHSHSSPRHHSSYPYTPSTTMASLNWDRDPRLADLSNALRALGWVRL